MIEKTVEKEVVAHLLLTGVSVDSSWSPALDGDYTDNPEAKTGVVTMDATFRMPDLMRILKALPQGTAPVSEYLDVCLPGGTEVSWHRTRDGITQQLPEPTRVTLEIKPKEGEPNTRMIRVVAKPIYQNRFRAYPSEWIEINPFL